jgi:phospholipid transport system substrate-binding protein
MNRTWLIAAALWAGAGASEAGPLVDLLAARQARVDAALEASPGELSPAERRKLEDALTGAIDFARMAQDALGAEWEGRTPAERKEFTAAFEALLRASLLRRVGIYRVEAVAYDEEKQDATTGFVRQTVRLKEATTEVSYTFRRSGPEWHIVDYAVDGVSTVRNYRSQFTKMLAKGGFRSLVDRIRKRTAEIETGG